ncbi:22034_t:CDS:2 [Rhizophagus irregularis]|nr:22034_t:CDS:2 [Rhizophagus irregularis]
MVYLINDVLYSIFEELRNDKKSLYSCLLVDRTWCVVAVPILWKNPTRTDNPNYYLSEKVVCALFNVIYSHLPVELREYDIETYQHPSFNYINFWRHLDFDHLNCIIERKLIGTSNDSIVSNIRNEMLKLFINRDTKFTHLSIYINYDCQLYQISGTEHCFSELESFCYTGNSDQSILEGLAKICKSIKKLVFDIIRYPTDNSGFIKLIEVQKNLNDVCIFHIYDGDDPNNSFYKTLEEILIKHANTLKYLRIDWKPITRFLSYLVNLLSLEIRIPHLVYYNEPDNLKNLSFPNLRILKNCPNLEYLKLSLLSNADLIFPEFEDLLIKCKFLNGLVFNTYDDKFDWVQYIKDVTLFLNNWKDRYPISLSLTNHNLNYYEVKQQLQDYKTKGIIKKCYFNSGEI